MSSLLFFLLSHSRSGTLLFFTINLHNFTFSLAEERKDDCLRSKTSTSLESPVSLEVTLVYYQTKNDGPLIRLLALSTSRQHVWPKECVLNVFSNLYCLKLT